jgi:hypothetical protein
MPLPPASSRDIQHRRAIQLDGYLRADGLYEVDAHLTDVKTYGFPSRGRGWVAAGDPVHDMWLRLAADDDLVIREVTAVTDRGPYPVCPDITPNFQRLVGVRVGAGWRRAIAERVGGVAGCTHLVELLQPLGTVFFQTLYGVRERVRRESGAPKIAPTTRPPIIDTCHAYRGDGPIVAEYWPEWSTAGRAD